MQVKLNIQLAANLLFLVRKVTEGNSTHPEIISLALETLDEFEDTLNDTFDPPLCNDKKDADDFTGPRRKIKVTKYDPIRNNPDKIKPKARLEEEDG